MIWKGQVYNRQARTDFQQARPVLIVSGDASNHSEAASVTVLDVVPGVARSNRRLKPPSSLTASGSKFGPTALRWYLKRSWKHGL